MRVRPVLASVVASLAILGIGWKVGEAENQALTTTSVPQDTSTGTTSSSIPTASASASSTPTTSDSSSSTPKASASASATASATPKATATKASMINGTFTGSAIQTRYGVVQVKVTVKNSKVVDVSTVQMTYFDGRSQQIDAQAEPTLTSEAKQAGNANISAVSGATFTSDGYIQSLQSAIDKAGIS